MTTPTRRRSLVIAAAFTTLGLTLAGCSSSSAGSEEATTAEETTAQETSAAAEETEEAASGTVEIEDNFGTQTVTVPPTSIIATDNRTFQTLSDWGIEIAAAPLDIMSPDNPYKTDPDVVNLGNHGEPDLEAVVAVEPDLIVNGQRFASYRDQLMTLVPEASIVELDPRDGEDFAEELRRQTTELGRIFDKEDEAAELVAAFDESIERVVAAYDPTQTVMGVITSGGEIGYSAPTTGRTLGPVFDMLGLTPSLAQDGSTDHEGDDISVEAIAASNPTWILVMDRDAAVSENSGEEYTPANEILASSAALANVTAITEDNIIYMPQYTYLNEGIQTYTTFFNSIADAMEGA